MILKQATVELDNEDAIYNRYRLDGCLFNLRATADSQKSIEQLIQDLFFAGDAALCSNSERAL